MLSQVRYYMFHEVRGDSYSRWGPKPQTLKQTQGAIVMPSKLRPTLFLKKKFFFWESLSFGV